MDERRERLLHCLFEFSGQGFLSFGADMKVAPEYSRACVEIFGREIEGENFSHLLYETPEERADFVDALALVFSGDSHPDVVFSLLDSSVRSHAKTLELEFRAIGTELVVCAIRDVSERQMLESRISEVNELREVLLGIVMNRPHFTALVREADRLFELLNAVTASGELSGMEEELAGVYREVHTFKANASYLKLRRTVGAAHKLEDALSESVVLSDADSVQRCVDELQHSFRKDMFIVKDNLGPQWIAPDETMVMARLQLEDLEYQLRADGADTRAIADRLRRMLMVPYSSLQSRFAGLVQDLASGRAKRVKPLSFHGSDFLLDREHFEALSQALTHIVRNMVDHGIERPRERERAGKEPEGSISITAFEHEKHVRVAIEDDGRGIDIDAVKSKAVALNLVAPGRAPSREELLKTIFRQGFSTSSHVTPTSGRGVGLGAVRDEAKRLGAKLTVTTRPGKGTRFEISIPKGPALRSFHEG